MKSFNAPSCEMENLEKIKNYRKEHLDQIPVSLRPLYLRVLGLKSGRLIKAQCQHCICYEDVHNSVLDCRGFACPLYFQRPYKYHDTDKVKRIIKKEESNVSRA